MHVVVRTGWCRVHDRHAGGQLRASALILVLGSWLTHPAVGSTQEPRAPAIWGVGARTFMIGRTTDVLDAGWGFAAGIGLPIHRRVALRAEGRVTGLTVDRDPGGQATNTLVSAVVGLEVEARRRRLGVYAHALAGPFGNRGRIETTQGTQTRSVWGLGVGAGAGVRARVVPRLVVDGSAELVRVAELEFARYGGDPTPTDFVRTATILLTARVGLRWALRGDPARR